ncbi:MAG: hypothetical protein ACM3S2_10130 [Ignavibacteriales bacterium]
MNKEHIKHTRRDTKHEGKKGKIKGNKKVNAPEEQEIHQRDNDDGNGEMLGGRI